MLIKSNISLRTKIADGNHPPAIINKQKLFNNETKVKEIPVLNPAHEDK